MDAQALGRVAFDAHRIEGHVEDADWEPNQSFECLTFHHNERGLAAAQELPVWIGSDHVAENPQHRRVRMVIAFPYTEPPRMKGMFLFHGVRFVQCP